MRSRPSKAILLAVLAAGLAPFAPGGPAPILAQGTEPPAAAGAPFVETVRVNVVNIEVFATDSENRPVTDLGPGDFQIFEDGRPMKLSNFYTVREGHAAAPAAAGGRTATAGGAEPAPETAAPPAEDRRLYLVILVDNTNIKPFDRNRVIREVRQFLGGRIEPGARIMLATSERALHFRHAFTEDRSAISEALTPLEKQTGEVVHAESERHDVLQQIDESKSAAEAMSVVEEHAESVRHDLSYTLDALHELINALAGIQGRKAVLYVSDGLPRVAGEDLFFAIEQKFGDRTAITDSLHYDMSRRYQELTSFANSNRVTLYTLDARGLTVLSAGSAEVAPGDSAGLNAYVDTIRNQNLQSTLQMLAEGTGGRAILNTNRFLPDLERLSLDFNNYYSLGYQPAHDGDGRYHRIEVKARRKGVRLRYREGYRDKTAETRMADTTLSSLHVPVERNPLGVELELGESHRRDDGYYEVPVKVRIPIAKVTLLPRDQQREGSVRMWFAVMDRDGGTSPVQQVGIPFRLPAEQAKAAVAAGRYLSYPLNLTIRPGLSRLSVGVRDDLTAESAFVNRLISVGGPPSPPPGGR